jgi:SAM-dependent methyltransferase
LFGTDLALTDFPALKGIRGIGISDSPDYAERLAAKFDYRNTYYHKEPSFDVVNPPESELGTYDFLIASEVFEHVAPPVSRAFESAFRLLKPNGLFFFTVPYTLDEHTTEHFPELHDYGLAQLRGQTVLVNRTRDGRLEVHENLVFHGGGGSTLEIRRFTENDLRSLFSAAGFRSLDIYAENYEPFGIVRTENWSLPMTARKEPFVLSKSNVADFAAQAAVLRKRLELELDRLRGEAAEREKWSNWARQKIAELEKQVEERTAWARDLEQQLETRTNWALSLDKDVAHHLELAKQFQKEALDKSERAARLQAELQALEQRMARLNSRTWTRVGRLAGLVRE